jgi:hypothetical protein
VYEKQCEQNEKCKQIHLPTFQKEKKGLIKAIDKAMESNPQNRQNPVAIANVIFDLLEKGVLSPVQRDQCYMFIEDARDLGYNNEQLYQFRRPASATANSPDAQLVPILA